MGTNRSAILLPHTGTGGRVLTIQLGAQQMHYTFPVTDAFEQGKEYNYTITVKNKEIEVQRAAITDWQTIGQVTETEPVAADLVWIPEGSFLMGSPNTDTDASANEKPQHWVRFEKGFYMSKYLVTIQDYCDFINASNVTMPSIGYIANVPLNGNWVRGFVANNQYNVPRYNGTKWVPPAGFEHYPMMLLTFDGLWLMRNGLEVPCLLRHNGSMPVVRGQQRDGLLVMMRISWPIMLGIIKVVHSLTLEVSCLILGGYMICMVWWQNIVFLRVITRLAHKIKRMHSLDRDRPTRQKRIMRFEEEVMTWRVLQQLRRELPTVH